MIRIVGVACYVVPTLRKLEYQPCTPKRGTAALQNATRGIVSKHRDRGYRAGWSPHWIKIKNPKSPAMVLVKDGSW